MMGHAVWIPMALLLLPGGGTDDDLGMAYRAVLEMAAPSVVQVESGSYAEVPRPGVPHRIPPDARPYFRRPPGPATGIVISPLGHVLLSEYMLGDRPDGIRVIAPDGSSHEATLVGRRSDLDLALVHAPDLALPPLSLAGEGSPKEGAMVVVLGRTGPGDSVILTTGIVSALGRLEGRAIQVDAAIHPGVLGGPILTLRGGLVGVAGLFDRRCGWNSGVGFGADAARASSWVREVVPDLPEGPGPDVPEVAVGAALAFQEKVTGTVEKALAAFVKVGGGSGVVITPEGKVLTNHHVAGGHATWEVTFPTGERFPASLLGVDPSGDLALLQIQGGEAFPCIPLGDGDDIYTGSYALAFGNPFGFARGGRPTVTLGVISAIHRYQGEYGDSIQVDTPINPGNSGGPLLNLEGDLIGICGRMAWRVEFTPRISTGVGFAIPVTQIRNFLPILEKEGAEAAHGDIEGLSLGWGEEGVVVSGVEKGSRAEKAGFETGDEILRAAGERVTTPDRCRGILSTYPAGMRITLRIRRDGQAQDLVASLGGKPFKGVGGRAHQGLPRPFIGITFGRATLEGVEVWEIAPGSPAERAGIRKGDFVTSFRGKPAEGPLQIERLLQRCRYGEPVEVEILRGGKMTTLDVMVINSEDYLAP